MPSHSQKQLLVDRLQNAGPGEPVEVWIYSSYPKDHWVPRRAGDVTHADHPGTAIQIEDDLFEILTAEETTEPGYVVRYGMKRWDPKHAIRKIFPYNPETLAQSAADYIEEQEKRQLRSRILWLFPVAGLAPDTWLQEWEKKTALNMTVIAAASALTEVLLFLTLFQIFGPFPEAKFLQFVIPYLGVDGIFRLLWIVVTGKPHGTLILTLPDLLFKAMTQPRERRQKREGMRFSYEPDQVIRRPGTGHLTIRSMLFDDALTGPLPIRFGGNVYKPLSWYQEGKGLTRRLVYEFEKIEVGPQAKFREYLHPRSPERQKVVEALTRSRDRVEIFALLWGMYPRPDQLRLEAKYQYPSAQWTAITAGFFLACAVLQIGASIVLHMSIFALAGPVYFIFESLYRLYVSKVLGLPAASLTGYLFGLFIHAPE